MWYNYNPEISVIIFGTLHKSSEENICGYSAADPHFPPADIVAKGGNVRIWLELPGVPADDINVFFYKGSLVVSGIKQDKHLPLKRLFLRVERPKTAFCREFRFEGKVDMDSVCAELENGVLFITWNYTD